MAMSQGGAEQLSAQSAKGTGRQSHQNRQVIDLSSNAQKELALKEQHTSESSGLAQQHRTPFEKELQQVSYAQGKPIFAVDWDSASIESYESLESLSGQPSDPSASYNYDEHSNEFMNMN